MSVAIDPVTLARRGPGWRVGAAGRQGYGAAVDGPRRAPSGARRGSAEAR